MTTDDFRHAEVAWCGPSGCDTTIGNFPFPTRTGELLAPYFSQWAAPDALADAQKAIRYGDAQALSRMINASGGMRRLLQQATVQTRLMFAEPSSFQRTCATAGQVSKLYAAMIHEGERSERVREILKWMRTTERGRLLDIPRLLPDNASIATAFAITPPGGHDPAQLNTHAVVVTPDEHVIAVLTAIPVSEDTAFRWLRSVGEAGPDSIIGLHNEIAGDKIRALIAHAWKSST